MRNYHTHTFRCKHAAGDVVDYAQAALTKGLQVLGMSDHTPLPDGAWPQIRMAWDELPGYLLAIGQARALYPDLTILAGMECEWSPEYHQFYENELLGRFGLDYLVLGCHFFPCQGEYLSSHGRIDTPKRLRAYARHLIRSMESGLFAFVAHPDLFGLTYLKWDQNAKAASRDILQAAQDLKIPLEINGHGLCNLWVETALGGRPPYPWRQFWELAQDYKIAALVNSDAHRPQDVDQGLGEGAQLLRSLGLKAARPDHLVRLR